MKTVPQAMQVEKMPVSLMETKQSASKKTEIVVSNPEIVKSRQRKRQTTAKARKKGTTMKLMANPVEFEEGVEVQVVNVKTNSWWSQSSIKKMKSDLDDRKRMTRILNQQRDNEPMVKYSKSFGPVELSHINDRSRAISIVKEQSSIKPLPFKAQTNVTASMNFYEKTILPKIHTVAAAPSPDMKSEHLMFANSDNL